MNAVGRSRVHARPGAAAALLLVVSACASRGAIEPGRTDAAFREIQRHEARIERARERIEQGASAEQAAQARSEAHDAAEALCARALELQDADALTRCDRGREHVRALQAGGGAGAGRAPEGSAR